VIRANSELQHELQLRYDDVILRSHKLLLSRLSPRHTHIITMIKLLVPRYMTPKANMPFSLFLPQLWEISLLANFFF
jgi:hypothetical protein